MQASVLTPSMFIGMALPLRALSCASMARAIRANRPLTSFCSAASSTRASSGALRWRSFAVAVGVGMGATVMGFLIGQSGRFGPWYPWSLPMQTLASDPAVAPQVVAYSALAAAAFAALGLEWFRRYEPA